MNTETNWTSGWWEQAFVRTRNASERAGHPRGEKSMLIVVAYDITDPKRLRKVADCCKDFGIRVQYSVFECHLETRHFEILWERLAEILDPNEDRIVAYPLDARTTRKVRTLGTMVCNEKVVAYVF